jgi:nucleoside-diphosphate-sugar epimerase
MVPNRMLVTGASGLLGVAAIEKFLSSGWDVVGVSRRKPELPRRLRVTRFEPQPTGGLRPDDGKKRRHAQSDSAEAAKGCQKPSTPSVRPQIQPEPGTICAASAFI